MAITNHSQQHDGYLGQPPTKPIRDKFVVENERVHEIHNVMVHTFRMSGDVDYDVYAGGEIYDWQISEQGQWVISHAVETPMWHRHLDPITYNYQYGIMARLKGADYTYFQLKWGSK